tara:strand:- start:6865 stop:9366 length:2502 start_codon:yes stop_codon:yes gene_type:complete
MVKQQRRSEKTPEELAKLDMMKASITRSVSCENVNARGRRGIIKLTDQFGRRRSFYDHQVVAAQRLWLRDKETPLHQGRKAGLACLHDMGLGKTITAILMVAGIHMLIEPGVDELTIVVCPLSVLRVWFDTFKSWTTFDDRIVMAEHQTKITSAVMKHARVIITTPDVLVQAFKTFMWKNPKAEKWTTKAGKEKYRWGFCHGIDPKDKKKKARFGDKLPPIHPLFKHIMSRVDAGKHAFTCAVVDEVHKCSNPRTWSGHILGKICKDAVYTVGLTGTPVRARPKQVAWIVKVLNVQPEWLQEGKNYTISGGGEFCVRRSTVTEFHEKAVDRVDNTVVDLQPITRLTLDYDPFVGRKRDGSYDTDQQKRHDSYLLRAQRAAAEATEADAYRKKLDEWLWQAFTTMGQFTFDPTLGTYGAEAFQKEPQIYYKLARRQPSQTVHLIWRMLRDRQSKGHPRVVIYSESTVMLTIARNYIAKAGHCGRLYLFTGTLSSQQRDTMIKDFLSPDNPKGVLFMSSAGAIGTNICPGCDTMFVVGDVPWNNSELAQAHGRVHRITQDQPVEIVQFEPRRSVTSAKLVAHEDKRERLEPAMRDEDFSKFSLDDEEKWRLRAQMTMGLTMLDKTGNYKMTEEMEDLEQEWKEACEQADAAGNAHPDKPAILTMPNAELADDIVLPPVSYPIEGFVEVPTDDEDDDAPPRPPPPSKNRTKRARPGDLPEDPVDLDSDQERDHLLEMLAVSKSAGKRRLVDLTEDEMNEATASRGARKAKSKPPVAECASEDEELEEEEPVEEEEDDDDWIVHDEDEDEEDDDADEDLELNDTTDEDDAEVGRDED